MVSGVGIDGAVQIGEFSLSAGAAVYEIESRERPADGKWTQARVYSSLSYRFGTDPGSALGTAGGGR